MPVIVGRHVVAVRAGQGLFYFIVDIVAHLGDRVIDAPDRRRDRAERRLAGQ